MERTVDMGPEAHTLLLDFPEGGEGEYLISPRIGKDIALPTAESMEPPCPLDYLRTGTKIEVVGVSENYTDIKFLKLLLRHGFYRTLRSHRHEHRSFYHRVGCSEDSGTRPCFRTGTDYLEGELLPCGLNLVAQYSLFLL